MLEAYCKTPVVLVFLCGALLLLACTPNQEAGVDSPQARVVDGRVAPEGKQTMPDTVLDLALPESDFEYSASSDLHPSFVESEISAQNDKQKQLPDLFEKNKKDKRVSVDGKLHFHLNEEKPALPKIRGATVDVELKVD